MTKTQLIIWKIGVALGALGVISLILGVYVVMPEAHGEITRSLQENIAFGMCFGGEGAMVIGGLLIVFMSWKEDI